MIETTTQTYEDSELSRLLRDCMQSGILKALDSGLRLTDVMYWAITKNDREIQESISDLYTPVMVNTPKGSGWKTR